MKAGGSFPESQGTDNLMLCFDKMSSHVMIAIPSLLLLRSRYNYLTWTPRFYLFGKYEPQTSEATPIHAIHAILSPQNGTETISVKNSIKLSTPAYSQTWKTI